MRGVERDRFTVKLTSLDAAISRAREAGRSGRNAVVCLADVADNPGGGGRGNTTDVLEGLLKANVERTLLGNFVDPAAAAACHAAGVGSKLRLTLNEGRADNDAREIPVALEVLALSDGIVAGRRGVYAGRTALMGPTAAVRIGGLTMVLCSRRIQCADPAFFEHLGIDVGSFASLTVKSRGHFRAGFRRVVSGQCDHRGRRGGTHLAAARTIFVEGFAAPGVAARPQHQLDSARVAQPVSVDLRTGLAHDVAPLHAFPFDELHELLRRSRRTGRPCVGNVDCTRALCTHAECLRSVSTRSRSASFGTDHGGPCRDLRTGTPASFSVGRSGNAIERFGPVTASGRSVRR